MLGATRRIPIQRILWRLSSPKIHKHSRVARNGTIKQPVGMPTYGPTPFVSSVYPLHTSSVRISLSIQSQPWHSLQFLVRDKLSPPLSLLRTIRVECQVQDQVYYPPSREREKELVRHGKGWLGQGSDKERRLVVVYSRVACDE